MRRRPSGAGEMERALGGVWQVGVRWTEAPGLGLTGSRGETEGKGTGEGTIEKGCERGLVGFHEEAGRHLACEGLCG